MKDINFEIKINLMDRLNDFLDVFEREFMSLKNVCKKLF